MTRSWEQVNARGVDAPSSCKVDYSLIPVQTSVSRAGELSCFRFSSPKSSPRQWLPALHELYDQSVARRIFVPRADIPIPHLELNVRKLASGNPAGGSNLCVTRMRFSAGGAAHRTPQLLSDGNCDVVLSIQEAGGRVVSQLGREVTVPEGGGVLTSNADCSFMLTPEAGGLVSISAPRKLMTAMVPGLEDTFVRPIPSTMGVLQLVLRYLDVFEDDRVVGTPEARLTVATHIHDLCALCIGASRDAAEVARNRGVRAARLHAVKADIARLLDDATLSAATLATRQGVTPRYIHKLFESEGTTVSKFVLGQRLVRVHRMLNDVRYAGLTIGTLAYRAGFGDLSTFNREFRRRFGVTPSDVRAARR